jgi:hypothetical protein
MRNQEKKPELTLDEAIQPLVECQLHFHEQKMLLHEMFTITVANAPENELENFTANRFKNFYLALCETLENISSISQVAQDNSILVMDRLVPKYRKS